MLFSLLDMVFRTKESISPEHCKLNISFVKFFILHELTEIWLFQRSFLLKFLQLDVLLISELNEIVAQKSVAFSPSQQIFPIVIKINPKYLIPR